MGLKNVSKGAGPPSGGVSSVTSGPITVASVTVVASVATRTVSPTCSKKDSGKVKVKLKPCDTSLKSWVTNTSLVVWSPSPGVCDARPAAVSLAHSSIVPGRDPRSAGGPSVVRTTGHGTA